MNPITIRYSFRPRTRSLATGQVADLFGLDVDEPSHTVADNVMLDIRPIYSLPPPGLYAGEHRGAAREPIVDA